MPEREPLHPHRQTRTAQQDHHDGRRRQPGHHCGDGHPLHAHVEDEDQKGVARDVYDVHAQRDPHGDPGPAHYPEQGRSGAVNGQKRGGGLYNEVVGVGVSGHIRLYVTEDRVQHEASSQVEQQRDQQGDLPHEQQQLGAGVAGLFRLPAAQVLPGDGGASGGQGREGVDQQNVYRVHQGYGGDSRLTHLGDHHGVKEPNGDGQQLFNDQRHDKPPQILRGKFNVDETVFQNAPSFQSPQRNSRGLM